MSFLLLTLPVLLTQLVPMSSVSARPGSSRVVSIPLRLAVVVALCWPLACGPAERVVFRQQSAYQEIVVSESKGPVRTLRFGEEGAIQSRVRMGEPDLLLVPYVRAAMVGLAFVDAPERVLVVGVGGGSIPNVLRHLFPTIEIDAVDVDSAVLNVARRWFDVVEDDRLTLIEADGRAFLEQAAQTGPTYDLIFLDAYGESEIPSGLTTREFLVAVQTALKPEGVVVANLWSGRSNPQYQSMLATYQAVFERLWVFEVPRRGNRILVAPAAVVDAAQLAGRAAAADDLLNGQLDAQTLLKRARLIAEPPAGTVLVD